MFANAIANKKNGNPASCGGVITVQKLILIYASKMAEYYFTRSYRRLDRAPLDHRHIGKSVVYHRLGPFELPGRTGQATSAGAKESEVASQTEARLTMVQIVL
jgi:hypothetical protein